MLPIPTARRYKAQGRHRYYKSVRPMMTYNISITNAQGTVGHNIQWITGCFPEAFPVPMALGRGTPPYCAPGVDIEAP